MPFILGRRKAANGSSPNTVMAGQTCSSLPRSSSSPMAAAREWIAGLSRSSSSKKDSTDFPLSSSLYSSSSNPKPSSNVVFAFREVMESLRWYVESGESQRHATWLFWNALVPTLAFVLVLTFFFYVFQKIYRILVPYTSEELHQQALQILQPTNWHSSCRNGKLSLSKKHEREKQKAEAKAEDLWKKALKRDAYFDAAWVSLAALYVYRQEQPDKALTLIAEREQFPKNEDNYIESTPPELQVIAQDARALKQGHRSMVHSELAQAEYLTILATSSLKRKKSSKEKQGRANNKVSSSLTTQEKESSCESSSNSTNKDNNDPSNDAAASYSNVLAVVARPQKQQLQQSLQKDQDRSRQQQGKENAKNDNSPASAATLYSSVLAAVARQPREKSGTALQNPNPSKSSLLGKNNKTEEFSASSASYSSVLAAVARQPQKQPAPLSNSSNGTATAPAWYTDMLAAVARQPMQPAPAVVAASSVASGAAASSEYSSVLATVARQ